MLGVGKKFGNEQIFDDIIKEVDINNDGVITFNEFEVMMKKFLEVEIKSNPGSFNTSGRNIAIITQES